MSKQEATKVIIIAELLAGRFTNNQAAELLDLSYNPASHNQKWLIHFTHGRHNGSSRYSAPTFSAAIRSFG